MAVQKKRANPATRLRKKLHTSILSRRDAEAEAMFLSIGEGMIATDEHGNISRINDVALKTLGFTEAELIGKWYPETVVGEDAQGNAIPNIERPITQVFLTGSSIFKKIYYRKKDGSRVPVALTVSPIILNGVPIGAVEVFRDITEEIELENAKDEFISIASHQLRTPATVVKQYLGMLIDGYVGELDESQMTIVRTAYEHNEHQLDTISDLLKVAQADSNRTKLVRKNTDLVKLLKSVAESQASHYKAKKMELAFEAEVAQAMFSIDPLHIRMVLENLLDNARKYSPERTTVSLSLVVTKDYAMIEVRDEGYGIAGRDLPKLFQKFSRLNNPKANANGTGLGLYWAKKLVDMHNGTLNVASKLNKGTTFTITIPADGSL